MQQVFQEMDISVWNRGKWLSNAHISFAQPSKKRKRAELQATSVMRQLQEYTESGTDRVRTVSETIQGALETVTPLISSRASLEAELKADVITWLGKGALVGFGFESPRKIKSKPLKLPTRLWTGRIDWATNSLCYQGLRFEQIRILPKHLEDEISAPSQNINGIPEVRERGRPSVKNELYECFDALVASNKVNTSASLASHFSIIREWLHIHHKDLKPSPKELSGKTIRSHLSPNFKALREKLKVK